MIRSFRILNLTFIVLIMCLIRWALMVPALYRLSEMIGHEVVLETSTLSFLLWVLSVVLIAAGGYWINDVMDERSDNINGKGKPWLSEMSKKKKDNIYYILTGLGLLLGLLVAFSWGSLYYAVFHLFSAFSLYLYSTQLKNLGVVGPLVVSVIAALVPLVAGFVDVVKMQESYMSLRKEFSDFNLNFLSYWLLGYSLFAFLITLIRENIKALEDFEGDSKQGIRTVAVVLPTQWVKGIVITVNLVVFAFLFVVVENYLIDSFSALYSLIIGLLLTLNMWKIIKAETPKQYRVVSSLTKLVMLVGMLYLIPFAYEMYVGQFISIS